MELQIDERILCYRRRVSWNQPGHAHFLTFSCHGRQPFLRSESCCRWLADSVRNTCDKLQFRLWAYVFMPEHVHLLVYPFRSNYRIAEFLKAIKISVARRTIFRLRKERPNFLKKLAVVTQNGKIEYRFWQAGGGYDHNLWTLKRIIEKAGYCHANPVKRGLAKNPAEWKWSSFRSLTTGTKETDILEIDEWDDSILG